MRLRDDWHIFMMRAWSVRFTALGLLAQGVDLLPAIENMVPEGWFRVITLACFAAAFISSHVHQEGMK